jgi:predicted AAA+ superfamily ATPase
LVQFLSFNHLCENSKFYQLKKIPNLKHQITNKSQISIFNDQNFHQSDVAVFRQLKSAVDAAVEHCNRRIIVLNFEFGSLGFI